MVLTDQAILKVGEAFGIIEGIIFAGVLIYLIWVIGLINKSLKEKQQRQLDYMNSLSDAELKKYVLYLENCKLKKYE